MLRGRLRGEGSGGFGDVGQTPAEFFPDQFEEFGGLQADKAALVGRSLQMHAIIGVNVTTGVAIYGHDQGVGGGGKDGDGLAVGED